MRIGIDAKWLFSKQISGRVFIQNVLPELISLHPEIEWHIFLDAKDKQKHFPFSKENVHLYYIWAGFNMLSNLFVIPKYAKRLGLDVVFFQTFSSKSKSFKSVVFIHDVLHAPYPEYFTWRERMYFKMLKWTAPKADRIITTTKYVQDELVKFHYAKNIRSTDIAPLGVTNIFKPVNCHDPDLLKKIKQKYNLPASYLLFVGRLNARKNIESLIEAFRFVNDKNICLVIAGEKDWKAAKTDHLMDDPGIKSKIYFTGAVEDEELSCIYAMAKIFCFPSFAEGFGLPPLEAMASGVPVIVSNTTSMPEVCGNAALYIDPNDPKSITQKIDQLLMDDTLYKQKVQEGLDRSRNYTWSRTAREIMKSIFVAAGISETI